MSLYSRLSGLVTTAIRFAEGVIAPSIGQDAQTDDTATNSLTISSQAPWASAVTNLSPGNIVLAVPPPVGAGTPGVIQLNVGSAALGLRIGTINGFAGIFPGFLNPSTTNHIVAGDSNNTSLNCGPNGHINLQSSAATVISAGTNANNGTAFLSNLGLGGFGSFGGGVNVFSILNATTNPTSNPTGGGVLYATGGALTWRGSGGTITTMGPT